MTTSGLESKIENTRRAFERLRGERPESSPARSQLLEEVMTTIEELDVAAEELRQQNEELTYARLAVEARCRRYRELFDHAPDGFVVTDPWGIIREVNQQVAGTLGVAQERLISKPLGLFVMPDHRRSLRVLVNDLQKAPGPRRTELQLRTRDGEPVHAAVEVCSVQEEGGGQRRLYWVVHDLSQVERRAEGLESALAQEHEAVERLRALDELKNELLEDLSHDLRNPLSAILGFASVLEVIDLDTEQARQLVHRLGNNARKLERYMSQLLEFDQKTRGLRAVRRQPTNVGEMALGLAREWGTDERPVTVEAEPMAVDVEPALVERILENLIVNALKHAPPGTAVSVEVRHENGGVLLDVSDAGSGVPDEFKPRVFSRYFRLPGSEVPGTGLGLNLVARFTQMHGGRVWVEDRQPAGASFRVFLPGRGAAGNGVPAAQKSREESSGTA